MTKPKKKISLCFRICTKC